MNGIQSIAAPDADRAQWAEVSSPNWQAALPRLEALQHLGLKTLPTARVVRWNYIIGGVFAAVALVWVAAGASYLFGALVGAIAVAEFVHGHERAGAIETGDLGAGTIERLLDHRLTDSAVTASEIITATLKSDPSDLVKAFGGSLEPIATRFGRRYVRFADRFLQRYPLPLCPGERPLVLAGCMLRQFDHPKFLVSGVLAMTDRRLIFIVRLRSQSHVLFAEPITQFQVCEWYTGNRLLQRFQWILSVRRPTGQRLDLQFLRVLWSQQARTVFESLASISERDAPPALEAFWRRVDVAGDVLPRGRRRW